MRTVKLILKTGVLPRANPVVKGEQGPLKFKQISSVPIG
jgi:hypothetical protein